MPNQLEHLQAAYAQDKLILFVGAGVSMGLGLPPWSSLIEHMARTLELDPLTFKQKGSYLTLAEYFRLKHGSIGPLRSWMDREWHGKSISIATSKVHELIVRSRFRIIYHQLRPMAGGGIRPPWRRLHQDRHRGRHGPDPQRRGPDRQIPWRLRR